MNWLRNSLIGAILVVSFLLLIRWNEFQERQIELQAGSGETVTSTIQQPVSPESDNIPQAAPRNESVSDIPNAPSEGETTEPEQASATAAQLINVSTDVLEVTIDTLGGDIVKVALPEHYAELDTPEEPFVLLNRTQSTIYIAQSGLVGPDGTDTKGKGRPVFKTAKTSYTLGEDQDKLVVDLYLRQDEAEIIKRYNFNRNSYLIDIEYVVTNNSDSPWTANLYGQIKRDSHKPRTESGFGMAPFLGAAITTPDTNYKKFSFDDIADESFKITKQGGWIAMVQHYFVSAWIPDEELNNNYYLRKTQGQDIYLLGFTSEPVSIAPGSTGTIGSKFYAGPKNLETLTEISDHLALTLDFGWLWFIGKPLFIALEFIHDIVGNWGVAIILLTCLVKLIFFYPSAMSFRSMAKMRKLQPMMQELKERYGDDRQRMSKELMQLYKKEKVNPLGGCLPILLQMPVFIALYWVLMESVDLRHAPFFLWIDDLSVKDPYFVLPLIMGVTMFIQQKLSPAPTDPMQARVMQMMPIFFTAFMAFFPAGLVLYWVVNNTLSITQQYIITKQIEKE